MALARFLLADSADGSADRVEALVNPGETRTMPVVPHVPLYLLCWTAWADDAGVLHFRRDLYGRDAELDAVLSLPPPAS